MPTSYSPVTTTSASNTEPTRIGWWRTMLPVAWTLGYAGSRAARRASVIGSSSS